MLGLIFGKLKVIDRGITRNSDGTLKWLCECECGNKKEIGRCNLVKRKNATVSCGCLTEKHGLSNTPEYQAWTAMQDWCEYLNLNPKTVSTRLCRGYTDSAALGI